MTNPGRFDGWPSVIGRLMAGEDLDPATAAAAVGEMLEGKATPAQVAGFLVALRAKGESRVELEAMLEVVRRAGVTVRLPDGLAARTIDIVGTGGDKSNSVNVSTMAALVVAACGVPVCKHGNRASSSACGSADVLEHAGVAIDLAGSGVAACIERAGFGFCLAPRFHPAFRHVGPTRRELGVATVFNLLGPMANPAPVAHMLVGVADPSMMENMAHALHSRGVRRAWVVNGHMGLDELAVSGPNRVCGLDDGKVTMFEVDALDHGVARSSLADIVGGDAAVNSQVMEELFAGAAGAVRDIVTFNAGCALLVAGAVESVEEGLAAARGAIDSGAARATLATVVDVSRRQREQQGSDA
jgi:anthranilate phosphoribosyltransferase